MTRYREFIFLFIIALIALALRAAYLAEFSDDPEFSAPAVDAGYHDYWARSLAFGDWIPPPGCADPLIQTTPYFRPPGYPYFLAAVYKIVGPGYLAPRIVQLLLGVLNCILAYLLAKRIFGSGMALLLAAFMSSYWSFIYFEMEFLEPVVAITLSLLLIRLLVRWTDKHTPGRMAAAGLVLGIFALVRSNVLLFGAAGIAWSWWLSRRQGLRPGRWAAMMAIYAGCAALVITPVTTRNLRVSGEFVPISSNDGINLFLGNNEKANGMVSDELAGLGSFRSCFDYPAIVQKLETRLGKPVGYAGASAYFRNEAWNFMREHPRAVLALAVKKTLLFWGPLEVGHNREDEIVRVHSRILRSLPGGFSVALTSFVLGLLIFAADFFKKRKSSQGVGLVASRQMEAALLIVIFVAAYSASYIPFFVAGRYRMPEVPFLLLFGAFGLHHVCVRVIQARDLRAMLWLVPGSLMYMGFSSIPTEYRPSEARWLYGRGIAFEAKESWDHAASAFRECLPT